MSCSFQITHGHCVYYIHGRCLFAQKLLSQSQDDYLQRSILNPAHLVGNMTTPLLVKTPKRSFTVIEVRRGAKFSGKKLQREQSKFTQLKQVGTSLLDI